jgi:hypothetical protein
MNNFTYGNLVSRFRLRGLVRNSSLENKMKSHNLSTRSSKQKKAKSSWLTRLQQRLFFFFMGVCFVSLVATQFSPLSAQDISQASVKELLDGNQVYIQERQANVNDVARLNESVRTGSSRAELAFNTGAVARLSQNSVLTVGQCARLDSGVLLVNGAINGCTSSVVAGVQGTTYLLEVDDKGNQKVTVLEGTVTVTKKKSTTTPSTTPTPKPGTTDPTSKPSTTTPSNTTDTAKPGTGNTKQFSRPVPTQQPTQQLPNPTKFPDPNTQQTKPLSTPQTSDTKPVLTIEPQPKPKPSPTTDTAGAGESVVLTAGQKLEVDNLGALGLIQKLSQGEFEGLLRGDLFSGFASQIPGIDNVRRAFEGLFPGISFPMPQLPSIPGIPSLPRLPF